MSGEGLRKHPGLGPLLKSWRRQVRLTQQEVAEAVSSRRGRPMTANWYAKLENRENAYPSGEDLDHLLAVLGRTRWEAEQALGGASVAELRQLAAASPEPHQPDATWSADVVAGAAVEVPGDAIAPAAPPRARGFAASAPGARRREPADDELRAALRHFGLSGDAVEDVLAYARSLRARSRG